MCRLVIICRTYIVPKSIFVEVTNHIAQTLFLPLKARALAHKDPDLLFLDEVANAVWKKVGLTFIEGSEISFIEMIVARTQLFDRMLNDVLQHNNSTLVVNLGAGLCTRAQRFNSLNSHVEWIHVDVKEVIDLRNVYFPEEQQNSYVLNLKNLEKWAVLLTTIFQNPSKQIVFMAEGVFSYFTAQEFTFFTEKIIEQATGTDKKVAFCFDCSHPNYSFQTSFEKLEAFKEISFLRNYADIDLFSASLSISSSIKKYRLPFSVLYSQAYEQFLIENNGKEPYYAGRLDFVSNKQESNILGTYFNKTLELNTAYSQVFLRNGMCFFWSKNKFHIVPIQEWLQLKFYLEDALSFKHSNQELQIYYAIEKLINANILIEKKSEVFENTPCFIDAHFFPNKFWAQNQNLLSFIKVFKKEEIVFVFTHDFNDVKAQDYAKELLNVQKKCYVILLEKDSVWVSPLFTDIDTFSIFVNCLELNVPHLLWAKRKTNQEIYIPCPTNIKVSQTGIQWLLKFLQTKPGTKTIIEFDCIDQKILEHAIADYETLDKTIMLPTEQEVIIDQSSGYRTKIAKDILKDCYSQISAVSGVISPPELLVNRFDSLVTYSCTYPTRIPFDGFENKLFFNQSLGKGIHKQQSKISAIAEAFERFSMNYNGKEDVFIKEYFTNSDSYIDPLSLCMFSEEQYSKGVYNRLQEGVSIHWTQGFSLTHQKKVYLPAVLCYQNAPFKERNSLRFSSNGCATGNTVKEAILQGLLELIERDAVALWWYQKRECPGVSLSNYKDWVLLLEKQGWKVWVLDVTTNIEIPVRVAVAQSTKIQEFRLGFGAHLDADIATARAISEVHQIIEVAAFAKTEFDFSKIKKESFLLPSGVRKSQQVPNVKTIDKALEIVQSVIEKQGFQVFYKNLSRSNLALKTVKVFVPGLCFIWPEFGNTRLYKNALGEIKFTEEQLNSLALFV